MLKAYTLLPCLGFKLATLLYSLSPFFTILKLCLSLFSFVAIGLTLYAQVLQFPSWLYYLATPHFISQLFRKYNSCKLLFLRYSFANLFTTLLR